ncbi:hypothetical protein ABT120_19945 [Nonomuraea angiospora]|uniref:hypothetical protein n=1 Tax=Nonomuraea angiospora TaxID=46172 RepID=UPI00332E288A
MIWWQQLLLTGIGALVGGAISLATTLFAMSRQWQNERRKRMEDQGRSATLELLRLLAEIRDVRGEEESRGDQPTPQEELWERVDRLQAWRDTVETHAYCIDNGDLRRRILEFRDKEYALEWDHVDAVDHLRECCGAFLRHKRLPPEPSDLREGYEEINWSLWPNNAEHREDWREELKRERRERRDRDGGDTLEKQD